jgi:hypothetical protein
VTVTKRLVCSKCQSRAVRAFRFIDDELQPVFPLAQKVFEPFQLKNGRPTRVVPRLVGRAPTAPQ